ncbi:hypothetical protein FACS18942_03320 [Planctomycetales bacterium]|nr:hypothetical protein FACS18942_03320 [Planctomycetales bacterium]
MSTSAVTYEQVLDLINRMAQEHEKYAQEAKAEMVELRRSHKLLQKEIGALGGSIGNFVAEMVNGNVVQEFQKLGYLVGSSTQKYKYWDDERKNVLAEADLILLNGDIAVIVEVKLTAETKDVPHFLKALDIIKTRPDRITAGLKLIGAIAGGVIDDSVVRFAQKSGLYVIRQNDDTFEIVPALEGFQAKVW